MRGSSTNASDRLFFALVAGLKRSLNLKLSDTGVYEPQIRQIVNTFCVGDAAKVGAGVVHERLGQVVNLSHSVWVMSPC